ncbi:hypothetical protein J8L13_15390 [Bacteroides fragilis]|uniref:hypothetical protein n=1 Tax=Bacteroides fragilis TaxID=817 RepID=UPI00202F317A|nr:hypothetical protein [Bacteroides fragilis]MCM0238773.1 hypothetical protein [Bacteroides fragilis]
MKKKHTLMNYLAAAICGATALLAVGCTADDDFGRLPQGSIPLRVGEVTVAGMKPGTRAAGGNASTRAVVSETPATGYTGIRKSRFVDGDVLNLTLSNDGGGTNTPVTATLTGGVWVLSEKAYVISGTTTIRAAHAGTEVTAGIRPDALEVTEYALDGQKVTFVLKHAHAMIDITLPTGSVPAGVTITSITLAANNGMTDETLTTVVEEETDGNHYRTIALPGTTANPGSVKSLTAVINGQSYVATLATPLTVAANKKYPISLTFKENKLTATVGAASLDWGAGETINIVPAGYTRVIRTPEDLAQFAKDVNDDAAATGACLLKVLQVTDIDLSQLKPAAEAGTNPLTGTAYTYTATKDAWVPIGTDVYNSTLGATNHFKGTYNGNGHTISNVKLIGESQKVVAFFRTVEDGTLTGIHLRNVQADISQSAYLLIGTLVGSVEGASTVTLCSATGSLKVKVTGGSMNQHVGMGGLIYTIVGDVSVTRCSADVDMQGEATDMIWIGGFASEFGGSNAIIAGCSSVGDISYTSPDNRVGGFLSNIDDCNTTAVVNCYCSGTLTDNAGYSFVGSLTDAATSVTLSGCYSTSTSLTGGNLDFTGFSDVYNASFHHITDCASTATQITTIPGITGGVAVADLYATVTASNASLADVRTLHWSTAEGYTLTPVTNTWYAADVWKDNGTAAPTLDLTYERWDGLYEGWFADELAIAGLTAYYVAPKNAKNASGAENMTWAEAMAAGVCPKGWHVPTKDEYVAMTGIPADKKYHSENFDAIKAVFPAGYSYWLSTEYDSDAWGFTLNNNSAQSYVGTYGKGGIRRVRCVRKK